MTLKSKHLLLKYNQLLLKYKQLLYIWFGVQLVNVSDTDKKKLYSLVGVVAHCLVCKG